MASILVLDNHPVVREGCFALLRASLGEPDLFEAGKASDALAILRRYRVDLVILEPDLAGNDGLRLIKTIRKRWPETMVVAFTGLRAPAANEVRWRAARAGAAAFVHKESPASEFVQGVGRVLAAAEDGCAPRCGGFECRCWDDEQEPPRHAALSDREFQVFRLLASGRTGPEVGRILSISAKTVNTHRRHIYRKLDLSTVSDLSAYAYRHRLVPCRRISDEPKSGLADRSSTGAFENQPSADC